MTQKNRRITVSVVATLHYSENAAPENQYMAIAQGHSGFGASEEAAIRDLTARIEESTDYRLAHAE